MVKYALVPEIQWKYLREEMTLEEAKKLLGDVNPDTTKYTAEDGKYKRIARDVRDADYRGDFEVLGKDEIFKLTDFYEKDGEIALSGNKTHDPKKPQADIRTSRGKLTSGSTTNVYSGPSIMYSLMDLGRTLVYPIFGKKYKSSVLDIAGVGNLSVNEWALFNRVKAGLSPSDDELASGSYSRELGLEIVDISKKYLWGGKITSVTRTDNGEKIVTIGRDKYKWVSPWGKISGGSSKFPVPFVGVDSGFRVTVGHDDECELYSQQTDYLSDIIRTLLGRRKSDVILYAGTDSEFHYVVEPNFELVKRLQRPNPIYWAKNIRRMIFGGELGFQETRHIINLVSPLAKVDIYGINKKGQKVGGYILPYDETVLSDPEYVFMQYTPDGSLLFNYTKLVDSMEFQQKIARSLRHVDPMLARNMIGAQFSRDPLGKGIVVESYDEDKGEKKILGNFVINQDKCYFVPYRSGVAGVLAKVDIEIGEVRNENGSQNVYVNERELGCIVLQRGLNVDNAIYFTTEAVDVSDGIGDEGIMGLFTGGPSLSDVLGGNGDSSKSYSLFDMMDIGSGGKGSGGTDFMDGIFGMGGEKKTAKKEVQKKKVMVPHIDTDKVRREYNLSMFFERDVDGVDDVPGLMSWMVTACGVDAEKLKFAHGDPSLKRFNRYNLLTYIDNMLDLTATQRHLDSYEKILNKELPINLLPKEIAEGASALFGVSPPEEYRDLIYWDDNA